MADISIIEGITTEHLAEVYSDQYIQRIGYDYRPAAPVVHPLATYLSAWVSGKFVGAFLAIRHTLYEYELHALLLKSAITKSRDLGKMAISWAFSFKDVLRVTTHIPESLKSAINYVKKIGFIVEGKRRHGCIKDSIIQDIYLFGITREEWGAL